MVGRITPVLLVELMNDSVLNDLKALLAKERWLILSTFLVVLELHAHFAQALHQLLAKQVVENFHLFRLDSAALKGGTLLDLFGKHHD